MSPCQDGDTILTSDEELIIALRDGDSKAIEIIIDRYKELVRKKAGSMFILGADREDLIQEGMIGLYNAVRDYDAGRDASFYTFADLCVSRQMYKAVEAGKRKKHAPLNSYVSIYDEEKDSDSSDGPALLEKLLSETGKSPEDMVIDREQTEILEQKINESLSDFERKVLNLRLTGLEYTDIARILGRDAKSTDNALSRIKTKVRKILQ
ncbi:MAG: RNA polymerase sporulation sigma factor SigH [Lachnospiraceae bacterium]|nr:RNA polymerase sporulation sigma factor SigH [Lachnospiraceae bacterium]